MYKISFILPCYNIDRYIADCLGSIYAQGMPEDEFEVIAVNDCSTDDTAKIVEDYAERHTNLILINHTRNLTSGGARNTGIDAARGEYIWFVDPDDAIIDNCAKALYDKALDKNAEVMFFNYYDCNEHLESRKENLTYPVSGVLGGQDYVCEFFPNRFSTFGIVWRALFKNGFLKENGLRFPIMRKAQDVVFLWNVMLHAQRVCSVDTICYLYRNNPYSVMRHQLKARVAFSDRILRGYEITRMIANAGTGIKPTILEDMKRAIRWTSNSNLELLSQMSGQERANYYLEIKEHREAVTALKPYMNRKSRVLFDTSLGKAYWLCKANLLCKREMTRKGADG